MKTFSANRFALLTLLPAVFVIFLLYPGAAFANSPKEVKLSYDASTQMLRADITHSPISGSHYVEKVEVRKNGQVAAVQEYKGQSGETFTYTARVAAAPGDVIEVKATCSRFGSKTEKLKIGPSAAR
ncbi:MAG: hypothetical protein ABFD62_13375 [Syntrophaceae bacterium]